MPHTYVQSTGELFRDGVFIAKGYAGRGLGLNNPDMQDAHNVGPIPVGAWRIVGEPFDSESVGPFCLRLAPESGTDTRGRSGFLIHGDRIDSARKPNAASEGCIILPRPVRTAIWASGDRSFVVVRSLQCGWPADAA